MSMNANLHLGMSAEKYDVTVTGEGIDLWVVVDDTRCDAVTIFGSPDELAVLASDILEGLAKRGHVRKTEIGEELKGFIRNLTLKLQNHRSLTDAQKDMLFQDAYRLYVEYQLDDRAVAGDSSTCAAESDMKERHGF